MNKQYVAICEKVALTIEEAAEYSNIGGSLATPEVVVF